MRIRQRKVPFPISSLSPVPLSDPHLSRSPVVQLQLHGNPHGNNLSSHPPDQPNQSIGAGNNGPDAAAGGAQRQVKVLLQGGEEDKGEEGRSSNDTCRKGSFLDAEIQTMNVLQQSSSSHQGGRWYEEDRAFPLKKRKGSFERGLSEETIKEKEERLMKTKMKTKMNKKCGEQHKEEEEEEEDNAIKLEGIERSSSVKKKGRGGALLEGSRCSRVNGRGWRCCQQTLVGYSLCEHHLGKGRLRSMNNVRNRSMATTSAPKKDKSQTLSTPSVSLQEEEETKGLSLIDEVGCVHGDDDDEKKALVIAKKKTNKLGMVKARSISSLLGQSSNAIAVAENNE